jgi:hypothetical protein
MKYWLSFLLSQFPKSLNIQQQRVPIPCPLGHASKIPEKGFLHDPTKIA